jgi:hypothetical protein
MVVIVYLLTVHTWGVLKAVSPCLARAPRISPYLPVSPRISPGGVVLREPSQTFWCYCYIPPRLPSQETLGAPAQQVLNVIGPDHSL